MPLSNPSQFFWSNYIMHQKQAIMWFEDLSLDRCKINGVFDNLTPVAGMTVNAPEAETRGAVYIDMPVFEGGVHDNFEEPVVSERPIRWSIELEYPRGHGLNTELDKFVRPGSKCRADVYIIPDCVCECEFWAFKFPKSIFRHIGFNELAVPSDDGEGIMLDTAITFPRMEYQLGLQGQLLYQTDEEQFTTLINCNPEDGCGCEDNCRCFYAGYRSADDTRVGFLWTTDGWETAFDIDFSAELGAVTGPDSPQLSVPFQGICDADRVYFVTTPQPVGTQNMPGPSGGRIWRMGEDGGGLAQIATPGGLQDGITFIDRDDNGFWWAFGGGATGSGRAKPAIYTGPALEQLGDNLNDVDYTGTDGDMIITDVAYDGCRYYLAAVIGNDVATGTGRIFIVDNGQVDDITLQIAGAPDLPAGQAPTAIVALEDGVLMVGLLNGDVYEARCANLDNQFYYVGNFGGQILEIIGTIDRQILWAVNQPPYKRDLYSRGAFRQMTLPNLVTTPLSTGALWMQEHSATICDNVARMFPGFNDAYFASEGGQIWHLRPCNDRDC